MLLKRSFGVAVVALVVLATTAQAQVGTRISIGTGFGLAIPVGSTADLVDLGWHAQANLGLSNVDWPIALRLDLNYQGLGGSGTITGDDLRVISGLGNIELRLNRPGPQGFFLVAGPGIYNLDFTESASTTDFGLFGGLGYRFAMTNLFLNLEGRFHNIFTDNQATRLIPIAVVVELPLGN